MKHKLTEGDLHMIIRKCLNEAIDGSRIRRNGFSNDGHKAYTNRMNTISNVIQQTMRNMAASISEITEKCKTDLYNEGITDAEVIVGQWEREIRKAIFNEGLREKFL